MLCVMINSWGFYLIVIRLWNFEVLHAEVNYHLSRAQRD